MAQTILECLTGPCQVLAKLMAVDMFLFYHLFKVWRKQPQGRVELFSIFRLSLTVGVLKQTDLLCQAGVFTSRVIDLILVILAQTSVREKLA